jgi:hypothetical protein
VDFNFNGWGNKQRTVTTPAGGARGQLAGAHTSAASWWAKVAASKWTATAPGS